MDYVNLGRTGLKVSRLCLGCMTYGEPGRGTHDWTLPEAESRPFITRALEAGINFFDTANVYSAGSSEEILGRALRDITTRDAVVVATKVHGPMHTDPNGRDLSRKAILAEIDASLARLGMEYVDLYQIHRFDPDTRSRRRLRRCTTWCARARHAISARRPCMPGSSAAPSTCHGCTAGPGLFRCRTILTCSTGRRSGR